MARNIFVAIVCVSLLAACGHSSPSPVQTTSSGAAPQSSTRATTAPAAVLGCGTYCQQAGDTAGTVPPGYPCPKAGCLRCPPQNCVTLESSGATATNGVATVKLTCNLRIACRGVFLICLSTGLCNVGSTHGGDGGRLAGSDFLVHPRTTSDVGIALTTLGKQVASGPGGFEAQVLVDLLDYGIVFNTLGARTSNFSLASTDPPVFPAGATASCGGVIFVGSNTSCPFARNVYKAYSKSYGSTVRVFSPVTGKSYVMRCNGGSPHVCRGGTNALVELYH